MEFAKFIHPSTFSYIGRNGLALKYLLTHMSEPRKILEAGSGCIEPIVFSQILPNNSEIYAVDANEQIINVLRRLINNGEISLESLASVVCNKRDDGNIIVNNDLTDLELVSLGLKELELAGVNPSLLYKDGLFKKPSLGAKIYPINMDIFDFAKDNIAQFDLAFAGFLFLNLGKTLGKEGLKNYAQVMLGSLKPEGILGLSTTPANLYGPSGDPVLFLDNGAEITDIVLDNLVSLNLNGNKKLLGGYLIRLAKEITSGIDLNDLRSKVYGSFVIPNLNITESTESSSILFERDYDRILLAAKLITGETFKIWYANKEEVLSYIPNKRTLSGLL